MNQPVQAVLVGAGQRGMEVYGRYATQHPDQLNFVAVAEPNSDRRAEFAARHDIDQEMQFESWEKLFDQNRIGQAALICTQDQMHTEPTLAGLKAGYHILLEKSPKVLCL